MRYAIVLSPEAVDDFRALKTHHRAEVRDAIEVHLPHQPMAVSRVRIKKLEAKEARSIVSGLETRGSSTTSKGTRSGSLRSSPKQMPTTGYGR